MSGNNTVFVTGITPPDPLSPPPRLEINDILSRPNYLSLYLRALQHFQDTNKDEVLSWFQIGGIHGRPFKEWNGVPRHVAGFQGYCPHRSVLFGTWHRSWLGLFEQAFYKSAQAVVAALPQGDFREDLDKKVLPELRIPYWDWAKHLPPGSPTVPDIFKESKWTVTGPEEDVTIDNPLYRYNFKTIDKAEFPEVGFNTWLKTLHYPIVHETPSPDDESDSKKLEEILRKNHGCLTNGIYHLLCSASYSEYESFIHKRLLSNDDSKDYGERFNSLEALHGLVHNLVGGGGHMATLEYSCFDPKFHHHHGFVDRIYAFWQVLNPDSRIVTTFNDRTQQYEGELSALTPFHQQKDIFWNSKNSWDVRTFGSNYIELENLDPAKRRKEVETVIRTLYYPGSPQYQILNYYPKLLADDGTTTEYFITIEVEEYALNGPFNIEFFLGEHTTTGAETEDANFVGTYGVFAANPKSTSCERCKKDASSNVVVTGTVPLTNAILRKIGPDLEEGPRTLNPDEVGPYVRRNLKWKIYLLDGTPISHDQVPSLKVGVSSSTVSVGKLDKGSKFKLPDGSEFHYPKHLLTYKDWKGVIDPVNRPLQLKGNRGG